MPSPCVDAFPVPCVAELMESVNKWHGLICWCFYICWPVCVDRVMSHQLMTDELEIVLALTRCVSITNAILQALLLYIHNDKLVQKLSLMTHLHNSFVLHLYFELFATIRPCPHAWGKKEMTYSAAAEEACVLDMGCH